MADESGTTEWREHAKIVAATDPKILSQIIGHFSIDAPAGSPNDTLPPLFTAKLISADSLDDAIKWAHGWVKETIDALLHASKPARLSHSEFRDALLAFVKAHDRLVVLRSYAGTPDTTDVDSHLAFKCYVRQLRIIDLPDVELLEAVNDFLRASIDRTEWARRGLITETSLDEFERELVVTWRNKQRKVSIGSSHVRAEHQGQLLYADCMDHSHPLDGLQTPQAFLRGSFHSIADDRKIGWHPDYTKFLADTDNTGAES